MWWPSPTDLTCTEVTEEKTGRTAPSLKRHRAWGLEELLAFKLSFKEVYDNDTFGNDDGINTSSTVQTDVTGDTDVTACLHDEVITSEELRETEASSTYDLLNICCST